MNFTEVEKFYGQLAKKNAIGESLAKRIRSISSEPELQKLIQDEILPLARKMGYDFSEKDLLEYERTVSQRLSAEDLLDVSGGVSLKSALLSGGIFSLAMLGFGALSPMQADAIVPKAAVESATGRVVAGAKEDTDKIFKDVKAREEKEIIEKDKNELANKLEEILQKSDKQKFISNLNTYRAQGWKYEAWKQAGWATLNKEIVEKQINDIIQGDTNLKSDYEILARFYNTFIEYELKECCDLTFERYQEIFNVMEDLDVARDTLQSCEKYGVKLDEINETSIRTAINTLRGEGAPAAGLAADKEMVIQDTEMLVEEAKDEREIELSQTDYGYILDAWNGAEALVYKLTGFTENFRFLNPTNCPTLEKKDGEKYFRWKYNEDSGDGFGELMRILFPCSDGARIVVDGGAPNVPVFSRDCKPTSKLMAQIAALLYKCRTAAVRVALNCFFVCLKYS